MLPNATLPTIELSLQREVLLESVTSNMANYFSYKNNYNQTSS